MTDYIFEIQCYEKGNLLKEFAELCGYKLGLYYFYDRPEYCIFCVPNTDVGTFLIPHSIFLIVLLLLFSF